MSRMRFVDLAGFQSSARSPLRRRLTAAGLVLVMVAIALVVGGWRLTQPVPVPVVVAPIQRTVVPGPVPVLPWPSVGEAAVEIPALGLLVQSGVERPVAVASLTKIMTAYIVLHDHPLSPGGTGPTIVMTPTDVADAAEDAAENDTSVPVMAGERLTERQLLNGLLVHSANNFADTLARWDAGSLPAFVEKMNVEALALGMSATHYVDTNGIHAGSVSTAADQLRLTALAMEIPAFARIVDQSSVTEPLAGLLSNYVQAVGTDGVVGVKSGFTQAAMGCVVLAARRSVADRQILILAAVTGQPGYDALGQAQSVALRLIGRAATSVKVVSVVEAGSTVAHVRTAWARSGVETPAVASHAISVLAWPDTTVVSRLRSRRLRSPLRSGADIGTLVVTDGSERVADPVRTTRPLVPPSAAWRLLR